MKKWQKCLSILLAVVILASGFPLVALADPPTEIIHVVKLGESLWSIALKYNTTTISIKALNNLRSDRICVGQKLRIQPNRALPELRPEHFLFPLNLDGGLVLQQQEVIEWPGGAAVAYQGNEDRTVFAIKFDRVSSSIALFSMSQKVSISPSNKGWLITLLSNPWTSTLLFLGWMSYGMQGSGTSIQMTKPAVENYYFSKNHAESLDVIKGVLATRTLGRTVKYLNRKGDGRSSNSIRMYVGPGRNDRGIVVEGKVMVGVAHVVGNFVDYMAVTFRGRTIEKGVIPAGLKRIDGTPYFYDPSSAEIIAAWRLSREIGHERKSEKDYLRGQAALERWEQMRMEWGLCTEVLRIELPLFLNS